jgi:hypothetical protein
MFGEELTVSASALVQGKSIEIEAPVLSFDEQILVVHSPNGGVSGIPVELQREVSGLITSGGNHYTLILLARANSIRDSVSISACGVVAPLEGLTLKSGSSVLLHCDSPPAWCASAATHNCIGRIVLRR